MSSPTPTMGAIGRPFFRLLFPNSRSTRKSFPKSYYSTASGMKSNIVERKVGVWGMDIHVTIAGNGPKPVLCTPGLFGTAESDFRPILERMDHSKFTVICWDPPGFGKSRPPSRCDYMRDFAGRTISHVDAEVVGVFMKNLGYEDFSMMGFSTGGLTSLIFAASYPDRVNKLCTWSHIARGGEKLANNAQYMYLKEMWPEERWEKISTMYTQEEMKQVCFKMAEQARQMSLQDIKMDELAKDVSAPTLIFNGGKDPLIPKDQARLYVKAIPNSTLECWPDAGHDLHLQFPDRFVHRVEQFLLN